MQVDVQNVAQEKVGTVDLPEDVFGADVSAALLWEQVKAQRACRRRGTHKTKNRSEVSGGGAKPLKQKGSGRARQGSTRSPNQVGGGVVFGPRPRDYSYRLPRSARRSALRSALSQRCGDSALVVLDGFSVEKPRTKDVVEFASRIGSGSVLIVDGENRNLALSARNLPGVKYLRAEAINVYDILDHEKLVLTTGAIDVVVEKAKSASMRDAGSGEGASADAAQQ